MAFDSKDSSIAASVAAASVFGTMLDAAFSNRRQDEENQSLDISELYALDLKPPQGILAGNILCPKSVCLVAGEEATGKTWLMLWLAAMVAAGLRFGPFVTRKSRVLFLSEEMLPEEMLDRVRQVFGPGDIGLLKGRLRFRFRTGVRFDSERGLLFLRRMLKEDDYPGLVIVDALSDVHTSDENSNRDMGRLMADVRQVATDLSCCIAIIHHFAKPSELRQGANRCRGASDLKAKAADMITIERPAKEGSTTVTLGDEVKTWRTVKFAKVRHGEVPANFRFRLREDVESGRSHIEIDAGANGARRQVRALRDLIRRGGGTASRPQILRVAEKEFGWSPKTTDRWLRVGKQLGALHVRSRVYPATFSLT